MESSDLNLPKEWQQPEAKPMSLTKPVPFKLSCSKKVTFNEQENVEQFVPFCQQVEHNFQLRQSPPKQRNLCLTRAQSPNLRTEKRQELKPKVEEKSV